MHPKTFPLFSVLEDDLRECDYSSREYAHTVVVLLKKWAASKDLTYIPVRTFAGDWAFKKFVRIAGSSYVDISNDDTEYDVYWSELTVARNYVNDNINGSVKKLYEIVNELEPLLSEKWLWRYDNRRIRPINKVLDELCDEYNVVFAKNYADLVRIIRARNISV